MHLRETPQGKEKVMLWLRILLCFLAAATGLRLGQAMPRELPSKEAVEASVRTLFRQGWQQFRGFFHLSDGAFWTAIVIAIVLSFVILLLLYRYFPKRRKTAEITLLPTKKERMVMPFLLTAVAAFCLGTYNNVQLINLLSLLLGLVTLVVVEKIIMVLQDVYVKRNSEDYVFFERNKKVVLQVTTLTGLALVGLPMWVPDFWGLTLPQFIKGSSQELLSYYAALLSLTFISISVMGVLSDRSVVIYWDNIAEGKLIKPVFGSFAALTYYSVGATLGAGICVVLDNFTAFIIFCVINIATLIRLTFTMVDVYYDREGKKSHRKKDLHDDLRDYEWVRKEETLSEEEKKQHHIKNGNTNETYTDGDIRNMRIGHRGYEEKMMLLCQNISRAYDSHDLMYLQEVYLLYIENLNCFNTPNGKRVVNLLYTHCNADSLPLMCRSIRDLLDRMEKEMIPDTDPFAGNFFDAGNLWNQDELLWGSLMSSDYLRQWLQQADKDALDKQELQDFIRLIARRLVILYNHMVAHHNLTNTTADYDYLKVVLRDHAIRIETVTGGKPDPKQIETVFGELFGKLVVESSFVARLLRVLYVMLENLNENSRETLRVYLDNFPLPEQFTPFMPTLDFEDHEIELWKKTFPNAE